MKESAKELAKAWNLPWLEMEVLIGGRSSIDLPHLRVRDWQDATAFILNYGYDPDQPAHQRVMHAVLIEALNFIERFLVPFSSAEVCLPPKDLLNCTDLRHILLWASGVKCESDVLRVWSCAVLRVIHTIAHLDGSQLRIGVDIAAEQVRRRFKSYLRIDQDGRLFLGDEFDHVELDRIEWKIGKSRESTILKLLHKRGNVAETIYDMMGVRIVTKRPSDVMMVIKFLRKFYMITLANCVPGRTRNNLIDIETFKNSVRKLRKLLSANRIEPAAFINLLDQASAPPETEDDNGSNPHTGLNYRAIQLTCRQLIREKNPNLSWLSRLESYVADNSDEGSHSDTEKNLERKKAIRDVIDFVNSWPGLEENKNLAVFFPFEVQVMDKASYEKNQKGEASHDRYKQSQIRAARRRVLNDVFALSQRAK